MKMHTQKTKIARLLGGLIFLTYSSVSFSQSCDTYPYQAMSNTIEFDGSGKFKLLATSSATVDFDDPSEVMSARREAELLAKRSIAEYINQNLTSEDRINSEINKSKTSKKAIDGSVISTVQRDEVKTQLSGISTKSEAVLKGVMTLGSCYTKGREIRVTVGIKSETLANAKKLGMSMGADKMKSTNEINKPNSSQPNEKNPAPVGVGTQSYDGSKNIKNF